MLIVSSLLRPRPVHFNQLSFHTTSIALAVRTQKVMPPKKAVGFFLCFFRSWPCHSPAIRCYGSLTGCHWVIWAKLYDLVSIGRRWEGDQARSSRKQFTNGKILSSPRLDHILPLKELMLIRTNMELCDRVWSDVLTSVNRQRSILYPGVVSWAFWRIPFRGLRQIGTATMCEMHATCEAMEAMEVMQLRCTGSFRCNAGRAEREVDRRGCPSGWQYHDLLFGYGGERRLCKTRQDDGN